MEAHAEAGARTDRSDASDPAPTRAEPPSEHETRGAEERGRRGSRAHRTRTARAAASGEAAVADDGQDAGERADFARTLDATPRGPQRPSAKPHTESKAPSSVDVPEDGPLREVVTPTAAPLAESEGADELLPRVHADPLAGLLEADAFGANLVMEPELAAEFDAGAFEFAVETTDTLASTALSTVFEAATGANVEGAKDSTSTLPPADPSANGARASEARVEPAKAHAPEARSAPPRPHDDARAADVLRQVRLELVPELKEAVIQLHPAELGRISIRLTIEDEGLVARIRAEKRESLDALERHLPELRAALSKQGSETQHVDLALGFHDGRRASDERSERSPRSRANRGEEPGANVGELTPRLRRIADAGGIDTYA